ncbi:MAG TPA: type II toxin-antitoxin system RatA family toxin [Woeseiaceae bacterium]|jgi:ribosome-associated toxin RatA of RatAB toxin-antitoxin module|nr:type II toxin-antitoxin system RatA family toxin [Woeseiaceae bacterium]
MRRVDRSALVPYSARDMFLLVADVEAYPSFLPWCREVEVHLREGHIVEATLELHVGRISRRFRTRNTMTPHERMDLALMGGPFRHLAGGWGFRQLGDQGSKVSLNMDFEFDSRALDLVIGRYFEDICNRLVDAFTQRAMVVYGEPHAREIGHDQR